MKFSAAEVLAEIGRQAPTFGVNPEVARAFFMAENSSDGFAKSGDGAAISKRADGTVVGALGVMQVMPATARGLQKAGFLPENWKHDPTNLPGQVMAGLAAIKEMAGRAKNPDDVFELAAMYNGGNNAHRAYLTGGTLPKETQGYFGKVAAATGLKLPTVASAKQPTLSTSTKPPGLTMTPTTSVPATGDATATLSSANSSSSTSKSVFDPQALSDFNAAITGATQANNNAVEAILAGGASRLENLSILKGAITANAKAAGEEASAQAAADGAAALRRYNILEATNLAPGAADNELLRLSSAIFQTDDELTSLKPEIDERMAVGFFDNPFQWLVNQTVLPGLVGKYNGVVSTQNKVIDRFKTLTTAAKTAQDLTTGIEADEILRKGVATKDKIAAAAAADLARVQAEASGQAARDSLGIAQLAGANASLASQRLHLTREKLTERQGETERETKAREEQEQLDRINKLREAAGGEKIQSFAVFKTLPANARGMLEARASAGRFGTTFSESFDFVHSQGSLANMAAKGGAGVRTWVNGTAGKAQVLNSALAAQAGKKFQKYDEKKELLTQLDNVQALYEKQAAEDMRTADDFNPFKLNYVTISKMPELANNPLAIFVNTYGPRGKEPRFAKVDEQYLLQRFAFSVGSGKMTMPDAVKAITEYYKVGTAEQQKLTSWNLFGLEKPEKGYAVNTAGLGLNKVIDLTNAGQVENLITFKVASDFKAKNADFLYGRGASGAQQRGKDAAKNVDSSKTQLDTSIQFPE